MGSGHSHELSKRRGLKFVRSWLMQLDVFEKRQREVIIIHYLHEIFQRKKQRLPKRREELFDFQPGKRETGSPSHSVGCCESGVISSKLEKAGRSTDGVLAPHPS